jgi:hypothetical protein
MGGASHVRMAGARCTGSQLSKAGHSSGRGHPSSAAPIVVPPAGQTHGTPNGPGRWVPGSRRMSAGTLKPSGRDDARLSDVCQVGIKDGSVSAPVSSPTPDGGDRQEAEALAGGRRPPSRLTKRSRARRAFGGVSNSLHRRSLMQNPSPPDRLRRGGRDTDDHGPTRLPRP